MKKIFKNALKKPVRSIYYFIREIVRDYDSEKIARELRFKNVHIGENCSIDSTALLISNNGGLIRFEGNNYIGRNVEIGSDRLISIGSNTSIQDRCVLLGDVEIGRNCLLSLNIFISSGNHHYAVKPEFYIKDQDVIVSNSDELSKTHSKKVTIEDDCWLGINVVIMPGITVGKGSVIGSNSVVTKSVAPYSIMGGIPSILIKKRLDLKLKESIDYMTDTDLPYFYSGFFTNYKDLTEERKKGGIKVREIFSVYLKGSEKSIIQLLIKKIGKGIIKIKYYDQIKEVPDDKFSEIIFDIENTNLHEFNIFRFDGFDPGGECIVLIQAVKTM
jgi:acetyltransferase-like isoleucine patch superfamily enzyme